MVEPTNNGTELVQDTKLSLRCRNGFISSRFQWETTVCSRNGTWVPDPLDYDCQLWPSNMTNGKGILSAVCHVLEQSIFIINFGVVTNCATGNL